MLHPKKREHALARRQLYLNYGALTLATLCERGGRVASLIHGDHEDPVSFAHMLAAERRLSSETPLMLSMPSFYALEWTQLFCRAVKRLNSGVQIVVGGRWVTGPDPAWLQRKLPEADTIVSGLGEGRLPALVGLPSDCVVGSRDVPDYGLHHRIIDGFERYQPSIEASRGCGMGCAFCEERDIKLTRLRPPGRLADLLAETVSDYGDGEIHPYLQSSFFLPNPRWAEQLANEVGQRGLNVQWRCETRVDGMKPSTVASLAASGLKVIDLGLEAASPKQVSAMNKASDPDRYLQAASELIRACAAHGVWVKANVLLYAGETAQTLDDTRSWLDDHADALKGVSVGPVVAYGPPRHIAPFLADIAVLGGVPVDGQSAERDGITQLHLSSHLSADDAEAESLSLSRRYMTQQDYFDLKSFSYYPRGYTADEFLADVAASDPARLPFRRSQSVLGDLRC